MMGGESMSIGRGEWKENRKKCLSRDERHDLLAKDEEGATFALSLFT
jgi:hypothetical protein